MTTWKTYRLKDVTSILGDGLHGTPVYDENGDVFFINGNNLENGHINIKSNTKRVSTEEAAKYRKPLNDRTILVSINGTIGNVGKYNNENCILGKSACYFNVAEDFDYDFIYYVIANDIFKNTISRLATGTTIKNVSLETMRNYTFCAPDITTQRRISKILGAIDDKIENNRRINTNLELQAQALYKQWFVDNRCDDWKTKKLSEFFNVVTGKKDANFSTKDGAYPFFTCSQDMLKAPDYSFEGAAILLAGNGDFNVKRYIGKFEAYQRTYVLIPFDRKYHSFLYLTIKHYLQEITGGSRGSVIKFITKGNIADFEVALPQINIDDKLAVLDSLYQAIDGNMTENENLATLRDTLLPKLMNGEIITK